LGSFRGGKRKKRTGRNGETATGLKPKKTERHMAEKCEKRVGKVGGKIRPVEGQDMDIKIKPKGRTQETYQ